MWDEVQKQIDVELQQLNHLIQTYRLLRLHCLQSEPDDIEILAIAGLLHSFYTGIENIFKRIVKEIDKTDLPGFNWHRRLLETVSKPMIERGKSNFRRNENGIPRLLEFSACVSSSLFIPIELGENEAFGRGNGIHI